MTPTTTPGLGSSAAALDLLCVAHDALRDELLVAVPPQARHTALMVVNALGIVVRELADGEQVAHAEAEHLRELVGPEPEGEATAPLEAVLHGLRQRTVASIRLGHFDAPPQALRMADTLIRIASARCGIDAPKAVAAQVEP